MKTRLIYLLPLLLAALITGCNKNNDSNTTPVVLPVGNYSGQFLRIRRNPSTNVLDTAIANLNLSLSQSTGYAVTGDTSTLHAGSYGAYGVNSYYIQFVDKTFSSSAPFTKYHLEGIYSYTFDGTKLNIGVAYGDSLSLQYNFVKN
jgi:hypothetical protein